MEKQLLIKFHADYADEFDAKGFIVMSTSNWEAHKKAAAKYFEDHDSVEVYFGTNEFIEYHSFNKYMKCFTVSKLNDSQYQTLKDLFGEFQAGYSWTDTDGQLYTVPDSFTIKSGMVVMIKDMTDV